LPARPPSATEVPMKIRLGDARENSPSGDPRSGGMIMWRRHGAFSREVEVAEFARRFLRIIPQTHAGFRPQTPLSSSSTTGGKAIRKTSAQFCQVAGARCVNRGRARENYLFLAGAADGFSRRRACANCAHAKSFRFPPSRFLTELARVMLAEPDFIRAFAHFSPGTPYPK